jgi:membrane fusion protein (multidrug efflux system)
VIVVCGAAAVFLLKRAGGSADASDDSSDESAPTVVTVQTAKLQRTTLQGYVDGYGAIEAQPAESGQAPAGARVAASVTGTIMTAHVAEGEHVNRGDLLFELDTRAARVAVDAAEVAQKRQEELYRQGNTSQHNLQDAQAQLAAAKAQLALLRVTAPLSGTVIHVGVRPGEAVDLTTDLADIVDLDRLAVAFDIPAEQAGKLRTGQSVEIAAPKPVSATLTYVGAAVDPATGAVPAVASIPAGSDLRPGQFEPVRIAVEKHADVLAAPEASVVTDISGKSVIAVVSGGTANVTPVATGLRDRGLVEVSAPGLQAGADVVTVGAYALPDKTKVKVVNP